MNPLEGTSNAGVKCTWDLWGFFWFWNFFRFYGFEKESRERRWMAGGLNYNNFKCQFAPKLLKPSLTWKYPKLNLLRLKSLENSGKIDLSRETKPKVTVTGSGKPPKSPTSLNPSKHPQNTLQTSIFRRKSTRALAPEGVTDIFFFFEGFFPPEGLGQMTQTPFASTPAGACACRVRRYMSRCSESFMFISQGNLCAAPSWYDCSLLLIIVDY